MLISTDCLELAVHRDQNFNHPETGLAARKLLVKKKLSTTEDQELLASLQKMRAIPSVPLQVKVRWTD